MRQGIFLWCPSIRGWSDKYMNGMDGWIDGQTYIGRRSEFCFKKDNSAIYKLGNLGKM